MRVRQSHTHTHTHAQAEARHSYKEAATFLACSATTPTCSCTSCACTTLGSVHPSAHPYTHHPVTALPGHHTSNPSHLDRDHGRSSCGTDTCDVLCPSLTAKALLTLTRRGNKIHLLSRLATASTDTSSQPFLPPTRNILCCRIWALPPPRLFGP